MCNLQDHQAGWGDYRNWLEGADLPLADPPLALPIGPRRPSEPTPIVSAQDDHARLDLLTGGWAPPPGRGGLVINLRSENRRDPPSMRGLTVPAAFYEYSGEKAPKSEFRFTPAANEPLAFAVIRKGGAYSLVTCEPGDDVAPIHNRQPVLIPQSAWRRWLTDPAWPGELIRPSQAGTLRVEQTR